MKARTSKRDSACRKFTTSDLPREEWDFSSCPKDDLFECWAYEFARETAVICKDVKALRKGVAPIFDDLVKALRARISRTPRLMAVFWYCPEFPKKPYLSIPVYERQRRLQTLWPVGSAALVVKPKIVPPDAARQLARGRLIYGSLELAIFEIDWTESDTYLTHAFSEWLKENRSAAVKISETRGAGHWTRRWADDLKALGAKRLLKNARRWEDAYTQTLETTRAGLYGGREEVWKRAAKRAESLIAAWERAYTSNQID